MQLLKTMLISVIALAPGLLAAEMSSDEAAIRALNKVWLQHIANHDALACANLYADDAAFMPPGRTAAKGHEAIRAVWQGMFDLPGFALTFKEESIMISAAGEMALDVGTYVLTTGEGSARVIDNGKYVIGWVKRDGEWNIATDIFNTNGL